MEFDGFGTHATCSIRWAILWITECIKIRSNKEKDFGGFGVVMVLKNNKGMCVQ